MLNTGQVLDSKFLVMSLEKQISLMCLDLVFQYLHNFQFYPPDKQLLQVSTLGGERWGWVRDLFFVF